VIILLLNTVYAVGSIPKAETCREEFLLAPLNAFFLKNIVLQ
jgi:hypothetical protein